MDSQTSTETLERPDYCNICGSQAIDFVGYDDGAGDFGTAVEEVWRCNECDSRWGVIVHEDRFGGYK